MFTEEQILDTLLKIKGNIEIEDEKGIPHPMPFKAFLKICDTRTPCGKGVRCDGIRCDDCVLHPITYNKHKEKLIKVLNTPELITIRMLE